MTTTPHVTSGFVLRPNLVGYFTYDCHVRLRHSPSEDCYDSECSLTDSLDAYWTGEIDTWGKLTIKSVDGTDTLYLFPDEIVDVEYKPA